MEPTPKELKSEGKEIGGILHIRQNKLNVQNAGEDIEAGEHNGAEQGEAGEIETKDVIAFQKSRRRGGIAVQKNAQTWKPPERKGKIGFSQKKY